MAKNWAIAIGINKYNNLQGLNYAKSDAEAMRDWLEQKAKFDRVFLFTDDSPEIPASPLPISTQPTYGNLRMFLRFIFEKPNLGSGDNLWFFFAGHGLREAEQDYLMLWDSDPHPEGVRNTAIPVDYVIQNLRRSGADNVVLFLDACRNQQGDRSGLGIGTQKHPGVITFYSCSPRERSYEIEDLKQGSFTHNLLSALQIQGEGNCATVERLDRYLRSSVPQTNLKYGKNAQNPYAMADPATKLHLILLPEYATLQDIANLKIDAFQAEVDRNWELAEQLWMQVNVAARGNDLLVKEAFQRIAIQKQLFPPPIIKPTTPRGERDVPPAPLVFSFQVITVDQQGKEANRQLGQAEYIVINLDNDVRLEMVSVPGGEFWMGSPDGTGYDNEKPQHKVTVQQFFMGKYQVTQAQWRVVAGFPKVKFDLKPEPSYFKGGDRPVEKVSWDEAVEFCARLSKRLGHDYRLPSEAEWEYACRAKTITPFHFGETITTDLANYRGTDWNYDGKIYPGNYRSGPKGEYRKQTTKVGIFPPNAFGLCDMHGNVWEWCQDAWKDNYGCALLDGNAWMNENDNKYKYRVLRGGSWYDGRGDCRSANRFRFAPDLRLDLIGFRVVLVGVVRILQ